MRRVGIVGGGQLGRMTIEEARSLLCYIEVLSPDYPAPAAELADETIIGALDDAEAIRELASRCDVLSYEIEHADAGALLALEAEGMPVIPGAGVLSIIQDKAAQKALWDGAGLPSAPWRLVGPGPAQATGHSAPAPAAYLADPGLPARAEDALAATAALGGFPVVQKSRRGGYDGRGVAVLRDEADASPPGAGPAEARATGGRLIASPSLLEVKIPFVKELAVVVVRDASGRAAAYPCVEMVFDPRANLCDSVLMPAAEPSETLERAERLALAAVEALDRTARAEAAARGAPSLGAVGVFGVELFLLADGSLLINEAAPRPHNSGHATIEACAVSQFMQYYRVLAGYPLGSTELLSPAMMVNLLGEPGASGEPEYLGLEGALAVPGVSVHLYGKREVRPFRKMGHLTAVGADAAEAAARVEEARSRIRVVAKA